MSLGPQAIARIVISSVAVVSGTGAILSFYAGNRTTGIVLAATGGIFGFAAAFGHAVENELSRDPSGDLPVQRVVQGPPHALTGLAGGRMTGRG